MLPSKRALFAAASAASVAFLVAPAHAVAAAHQAPSGPADDAAVRDLVARFVAAWNAHDAAAMAATYAEAGSLVDPFQAMRGRAAIEKGLAGLHAGPARQSRSDMTVTHLERLHEQWLLIDATQVVTGMLGRDGAALPPTTFVLNLLLQREGGGLRFRAVRVNFAPPPAPKA